MVHYHVVGKLFCSPTLPIQYATMDTHSSLAPPNHWIVKPCQVETPFFTRKKKHTRLSWSAWSLVTAAMWVALGCSAVVSRVTKVDGLDLSLRYCRSMAYPLVNIQKTMNIYPPFFMGKLTISTGPFSIIQGQDARTFFFSLVSTPM